MKKEFSFLSFPRCFYISFHKYCFIIFLLEYSLIFSGALNALNEYFDELLMLRVHLHYLLSFRINALLLPASNFLIERAKHNIYHDERFFLIILVSKRSKCVNFEIVIFIVTARKSRRTKRRDSKMYDAFIMVVRKYKRIFFRWPFHLWSQKYRTRNIYFILKCDRFSSL